MPKRTDIHRPGMIRPEEYEPVLAYSLATTEGGWPVPSDGLNCELDRRIYSGKTIQSGQHDKDGRCCILGLRYVAEVKFSKHGSVGKCSICGANFVRGAVWRHGPTDEYIHVGHTCEAKYNLLADTPGWQAQLAALEQRRASRLEELMRDKRLEDYYRCEPSMRDVLEHEGHHILQDMRGKVRLWGQLTEPQVALACRLYSEALCPERVKVETPKVPAPTGRVLVEGVIISRKEHDGYNGDPCYKITVKVTTPAGEWLCWGSDFKGAGEIGTSVKFKATLTQSSKADSKHFAFYKRPLAA